MDLFLVDTVAAYIGEGIREGGVGIVVGTAAHREQIECQLRADRLDVAKLRATGQLLELDASELLSRLLVDGAPDRSMFMTIVGDLIEQAAVGGRPVRVFGEMVALLAEDGEYDAVLALESLWNELGRQREFSLFCAYRTDQLHAPAPDGLVESVCDLHSQTTPAESYTSLIDSGDRLRMIAVLQQKAHRLEFEIAQRLRAEEALREQARTIETINHVGQSLVSELDQDQLVQAITDAATDLTGAQFGAFFYNVIDERGEAYTLYTLSGVPREAFERFPMPRNTALFGATFRGEGAVRSDDVKADVRYGGSAPYHGMPEGHLPVCSYLAAPVISRSGEVLGGLFFGHAERGVFTDRAEQILVGIAAQAAIALDNARLYRSAQDAVRVRDEFLAAASHDLKTPLGVIRGRTQLLQRSVSRMQIPDSPRLQNELARIDGTVSKMTRLVDTLLDATRLHFGEPVPLNLAPTDLLALIRRLVAEHAVTTDRHRFTVEADASAVVGSWDAARIERVLDNVLSNAVKYSPNGGEIVVGLTVQQIAGTAWATVTVSDEGIGVPADDLPRIFERFHRATNVVGCIGGTGIGLAAARQIVEQHGGQIAISSQEGAGSVVTIRLPRADG